MRKPCNEHMSAALPPIADIAQHDCDGREVQNTGLMHPAQAFINVTGRRPPVIYDRVIDQVLFPIRAFLETSLLIDAEL